MQLLALDRAAEVLRDHGCEIDRSRPSEIVAVHTTSETRLRLLEVFPYFWELSARSGRGTWSARLGSERELVRILEDLPGARMEVAR